MSTDCCRTYLKTAALLGQYSRVVRTAGRRERWIRTREGATVVEPVSHELSK